MNAQMPPSLRLAQGPKTIGKPTKGGFLARCAGSPILCIPGMSFSYPGMPRPSPAISWTGQDREEDIPQDPSFTDNPPHVGLSITINQFVCPTDGRIDSARLIPEFKFSVAFTSYLGVQGQNYQSFDGVLYMDSRIRISDITDGTSNTLLIGERPPSSDLHFGWWYGGVGQDGTGSCDEFLGVADLDANYTVTSKCPKGPYEFSPGKIDDLCDKYHYWSLHAGGANFACADGSVHFLDYSAASVMRALASRAGGEAVDIPY